MTNSSSKTKSVPTLQPKSSMETYERDRDTVINENFHPFKSPHDLRENLRLYRGGANFERNLTPAKLKHLKDMFNRISRLMSLHGVAHDKTLSETWHHVTPKVRGSQFKRHRQKHMEIIDTAGPVAEKSITSKYEDNTDLIMQQKQKIKQRTQERLIGLSKEHEEKPECDDMLLNQDVLESMELKEKSRADSPLHEEETPQEDIAELNEDLNIESILTIPNEEEKKHTTTPGDIKQQQYSQPIPSNYPLYSLFSGSTFAFNSLIFPAVCNSHSPQECHQQDPLEEFMRQCFTKSPVDTYKPYLQIFQEHRLNMSLIGDLTEAKLQEMHITKIGPRLAIMNGIKSLQN